MRGFRKTLFVKRPIWVPTFIAINIFVFINWVFAEYLLGKDFMLENFLVSPIHLMSGKWWTPVTSAFSHQNLFHFGINMIVLMNFGPVMETVLGRKSFFRFYLLAGITGSLAHCAVSYWLMDDPAQMALGASGAIAGVILFFSLAFPQERLYILGLVPIPAIFGAIAFVGIDIWGLIAQTKGGGLPIGHGAHLGGALAGMLYFIFIKRQRRREALQAQKFL